jgi:hypothetical protein
MAPSVPGQLGDKAVILVLVTPSVGQDKVRLDLQLQLLEELLDCGPDIREEAVTEVAHDPLGLLHVLEEHRRAACLDRPRAEAAQHDPGEPTDQSVAGQP